jgi:ADP-ribose diphosphatase
MKLLRPLQAHAPTRKPPEILGKRSAAKSRFFEVEAVQLRFASGAEREFERIAAPNTAGTVIVVAVPAPGKVLLVREYAVGLGLPMGGVDAGESMLQAANRELREETGYAARNLRSIATLSLAPCIFAYRAHIVLATDLVPDQAVGDEPEALEVLTVPIDELEVMVARGELTEARSLAALFIAREELRLRPPR